MDFVEGLWNDIFKKDDKKFREWLNFWISSLKWEELECRHSTITLSDMGECGFFKNFGTNDGDKGMRIRQSTVSNNARVFMKLDKISSSSSTKIDVAQLLIFLTYSGDSVKQVVDLIKKKGNINHACGCGCLDTKSCCNYMHLYIGNQSQNKLDTAFHELLKNIKDQEEYNEFIRIAHKYNKKFYAF